jgi:hypothetical protein
MIKWWRRRSVKRREKKRKEEKRKEVKTFTSESLYCST